MFPIFQMLRDTQLLLCALAAIAALVVLIARFNFNSILALTLAALGMGLVAGMNPAEVARSYEKGVGNTLSSLAGIIMLGAMLGKMLAESGGAKVVAARILDAFGAKRADWAILAAAIAIGIPVFFAVGFMLLLPIVFVLSRSQKIPLMKMGIPLAMGLSCMHACVPPHPGPMVVIDKLHANEGKTILYSLLIAIPMAALVGPIYGRWILKRVAFETTAADTHDTTNEAAHPNPPSFALTLATIFLPIILMVLKSCADATLDHDSALCRWCDFFGGPMVSMLLAVLLSFYTFGVARGMTSAAILKYSNDCLGPLAGTILVVGAGGGFNQILQEGGVADAIVHFVSRTTLSPLVLGWLVAALIRVAVGSSTVAITTAVGIVGPLALAKANGGAPVNLELLTVAMGAGSLFFSHVNDGGFWIVKDFYGISVAQTFKTWSVATILGSVAGLLMTLAWNAVLPK